MWVGVEGLGSLQLPCSLQLGLSFQEAGYTSFKNWRESYNSNFPSSGCIHEEISCKRS